MQYFHSKQKFCTETKKFKEDVIEIYNANLSIRKFILKNNSNFSCPNCLQSEEKKVFLKVGHLAVIVHFCWRKDPNKRWAVKIFFLWELTASIEWWWECCSSYWCQHINRKDYCCFATSILWVKSNGFLIS